MPQPQAIMRSIPALLGQLLSSVMYVWAKLLSSSRGVKRDQTPGNREIYPCTPRPAIEQCYARLGQATEQFQRC